MRIGSLTLAAAAGIALGACPGWASPAPEPSPREQLETRLDAGGPYLILATEAAARLYEAALAEARRLHPGAAEAAFDPGTGFLKARAALALHRPRHALILLLPGELDARVAWEWLGISSGVDPDPFVDVRSGFVTGATPAAAAALLARIGSVARRESRLPPVFVDNLGPNAAAASRAVFRGKGSFMLPAYSRRFETISISHAAGALDDPSRAGMTGAGVIHLGGHGVPGRIEDGLEAGALARLDLAPCVVFNGACYSGVTGRFFDIRGERVRDRVVDASESFCLRLLETRAVGYLASLHPDHGIPVYQEMEHLASRGGSLGDALKSTYDGIVIANGGKLPSFERLEDGKPPPRWTASEMMLKGTASRVLFGDPALIVGRAWTKPPFEIECSPAETRLRITARVADPGLVNSFTDTYHADLSSDPSLFNARALVTAPLPAGWKDISRVDVVRVEAARSFLEKAAKRPPPALRHRLIGFAVEEDGERRSLHVQVDFSSTGYRESPFVREGSLLELEASR